MKLMSARILSFGQFVYLLTGEKQHHLTFYTGKIIQNKSHPETETRRGGTMRDGE
jgi:hypothetical protein